MECRSSEHSCPSFRSLGCMVESPILSLLVNFQFARHPCDSWEETGAKGNLLQVRALWGSLTGVSQGQLKLLERISNVGGGDGRARRFTVLFLPLKKYVHLDANWVSLGLGITSKGVLENLYFMCFVSIPIETHPLHTERYYEILICWISIALWTQGL